MMFLAEASAIDDLFSGYWLPLVLKALVVVILFLTVPLAVGYMEHKVLAHMQARLGPMEAGRFHGWAQLVADGVKFIQKEDIIPRAADPWRGYAHADDRFWPLLIARLRAEIRQ